MPKFSLSAAFNLAKEKLQNSGCSEENCVGIIDGILDAELSGIKSHGFHYLPIYCNHLKIGKIKGAAKVSAEKISDSALKVNADNGFAHTAINLGFSSLFDMCKNSGIASMSIFNSYNCGVLGFHTKRIAEKGFVGMGFTNAPASIAPIGGKKAVVGTNPFSIAVPLDGEAAIIIDQSASCLLYTSPSPRDMRRSRMPSSA